MQNSRGRARAGARARLLNFGILDKKKLVDRGGTVGGGGSVGRGSARAAERDDALETDLIAAPRDAMFATRPNRQDAYATLAVGPRKVRE